jgi:hypothetical protein
LAVLKVVGGRFETWPAAKLPVARDDLLAMCAWATESGGRSLLIAQSHYESRQPHGAILQLSAADGALRLEPLELDLPGSVIGALTAADVDGDGDLDLFVGGHFNPGEYPLPCASRLFEQEGGRLRPHPDSDALFGSLGRITSALWADLDSDGFAELVLAQEWGPIQVFRNDRGKLSPATEAFGLTAHTGLWTGLAAGDFDSDGRIDLVAGNWGENTAWKASAQHPLRLYHSARAGEHGVKLVEAEFAHEIGEYGPVRSYGIFLRAFPELAKKFPNHAAFSKAALPQIAAALAEPIAHVSAASLQSCVLLNRGGRLEVRPLPLEAQLSPAFGLAACDLNGDGHLDILLAQNFFAFRPELARADAGCGLVLLGRGDGSFAPLGPAESGVSIPGEQRGAAAGRFFGDGRLGIVVGQNAGPAKLFLSKHGGRQMKLAGPPGNPDGIGAILRFDLGGKVLAHPIVAGGGWLSQSTLGAPVPPAAQSVEVIWPGGKRTKHVIAGGELIEARQQ